MGACRNQLKSNFQSCKSQKEITKNNFTIVIIYDNLKLRGEGVNIYNFEFYKKENGRSPVLEFLNSLPSKLKTKAFRDIELLYKYGSSLGEPYVKALKGKKNKGLYELRIKFASDIVRIFYFTYFNNKYVLLHGFIKKTMVTPPREIEKALVYMEDYKRRSQDE